MAAMRLSARGSVASATASVTSIGVPGSVGAHWAPQSLFDSGANVSATLTQR